MVRQTTKAATAAKGKKKNKIIYTVCAGLKGGMGGRLRYRSKGKFGNTIRQPKIMGPDYEGPTEDGGDTFGGRLYLKKSRGPIAGKGWKEMKKKKGYHHSKKRSSKKKKFIGHRTPAPY